MAGRLDLQPPDRLGAEIFIGDDLGLLVPNCESTAPAPPMLAEYAARTACDASFTGCPR